VGIGVVVQNGVYFVMTVVLKELAFASAPIEPVVRTQLIWALGTGFILVTVFRQSHRVWENFLSNYFVRESA
jgi:predicted membrane protein